MLSDYAAYYWCQLISTLAAVALVAVWVLRHQAPFHAGSRWIVTSEGDLEGGGSAEDMGEEGMDGEIIQEEPGKRE